MKCFGVSAGGGGRIDWVAESGGFGHFGVLN